MADADRARAPPPSSPKRIKSWWPCAGTAGVAVLDQFAFNADGTVVRVIARVDVGVNDPDGLCVIKAAAGRSSSKSSSSQPATGRATDGPALRGACPARNA